MTPLTRRGTFIGLAGAAVASSAVAGPAGAAPTWKPGIEGQRKADLGDGRFLNPIVPGDHPDPTILKDGPDYYMAFSSFEAYPGVVIWHSRDLVNWAPITAALKTPIGSVWAPELIKHRGRFYLYIPARYPDRRSTYVIWADDIRGPWSEPVDLKLPDHIDPGHAVGEDGKRYLFLSGGDRVRLTDDGLATDGPVEHVYDPWRYPSDWDVESFSPEGPKITRRGEWYYMITAVGGTAGPPTGHMVIVARSRSIHGPWENCPHNPVVRTQSSAEKWWSRGHATLVEGPAGDWWMVYHGYENGFWTLGRQCLLDPIEWTADGWFRAKGGDLSQPLARPRGGVAGPNGAPLSDDFSTSKLGVQWAFADPGPDELKRVRFDGGLRLAARGTAPKDSPPLAFIAPDQAYEIELEIEAPKAGSAGILLFYDKQLYCGLSFDQKTFVTHQYGQERGRPANPWGGRLWIRMRNDRHIITFHTSRDGRAWTKFDRQMEVSGYHHNVRGGFMALRPALFAAGSGEATFRSLTYRALS